MIQIAVIVLSILLIVIGIKGFTPSGLQFSQNTVLKGRSGMIVGAICIAAGIGLIPMLLLFFVMFSSWLGN
ncbi:hypothetical protein LOC68_01285 [Blastopirellula sp. JC732]|uniref:Uncharacterized protein n=1 Tax=Blastopirellula sediminis TaxID=2894196 RepID=A0A9X1SEA6_9BACT|nr:hypothetical protein [Blastopirellula sediminis]MCC9608179.1 hypothetical protein [Blastopirellula sediminis]MCC9627028.1 hypothetical protein [Blastopirellula sediminis]